MTAGETKIFARDQFNVFLLALAFVFDRLGNGGIHIAQTQICRSELGVHFAHTAFVASAFKFSGDERIENFFGEFD